MVVDGVVGPKTRDALLVGAWTPPAGGGFLVLRGEPVAVHGLQVVTMRDAGGLDLARMTGEGWWRRPASAVVDLFVLHWDCARSVHSCFNVLVKRKLGVHLAMDADGRIYQFLDLAFAAAHACHVNARSIGVEVNDLVAPKYQGRFGQPPRPIEEIGARSAGNVRKSILGFTAAQKAAATQLALELTRLFPTLPRQLPKWRRPRDRGPEPADGVSRAVAPGGHRGARQYHPGYFAGVCGHYHVDCRKVDPGVGLWPGLRAAGFDVA